MKRPATASIVVFVAVILVAAVIAGVLWFGTDGAPAIDVGGTTVSEKSVNQELEAIHGASPDDAVTSSGAVRAATAASVSSDIVRALLTESILSRRGERVTTSDRDSVFTLVPPETFRDYPTFFRTRYQQRIASVAALGRVLGVDVSSADATTALERAWRREAQRVSVTVDPTYGRWVPQLAQVVPYTVTDAQIRRAIRNQ